MPRRSDTHDERHAPGGWQARASTSGAASSAATSLHGPEQTEQELGNQFLQQQFAQMQMEKMQAAQAMQSITAADAHAASSQLFARGTVGAHTLPFPPPEAPALPEHLYAPPHNPDLWAPPETPSSTFEMERREVGDQATLPVHRNPTESVASLGTQAASVLHCPITNAPYMPHHDRFRAVLLPCQHHLSVNAAERLMSTFQTLACPICKAPWGRDAIEWNSVVMSAALKPHPPQALAILAFDLLRSSTRSKPKWPPAKSFPVQQRTDVFHDKAQPEWLFKRVPLQARRQTAEQLGERAWWEAALQSLCQGIGPERPVAQLHSWVVREGPSWLCRESDVPDVVFGMQHFPLTLRSVVEGREDGLPEHLALPLALRLASALDALHRCSGSEDAQRAKVASVLHTSVQPDHVLLDGTGAAAKVVLCGLGNGALVLAGSGIVLPAPEAIDDGPYTAPEVLSADDEDASMAAVLAPQVDTWGFAATCLFMLTGVSIS